MAYDPADAGMIHLRGCLLPWSADTREVFVDAWQVQSVEPAEMLDVAALSPAQRERLETDLFPPSTKGLPRRAGSKVRFRNGATDDSILVPEEPGAVVERLGQARAAFRRLAAGPPGEGPA